MIRIWRKVKWVSLFILILSFIFIASDCEKKLPPSAKNIKKGPRTYEELDEGRLNRLPKEGRLLRKKAYQAMREGEYEIALGYLREQLKEARRFEKLGTISDENLRAQYRGAKGLEEIGTMSDMARCFRKLRERDSALNLYEKCQVLAESLNDLQDLGAACAGMGQTYCEKREYEKAVPLFEKSMKLAKKTKNDWNITASYLDFADVYFAIGKYEESKNNLKQALEIVDRKGMKEFKIHTHYKLGKICYYEGDRLGMVLHQWKVPDYDRGETYFDGKCYTGLSNEMEKEYKWEELEKIFKMKENLLKCRDANEVLNLILGDKSEFLRVDAGIYALNEGLIDKGERLLIAFLDKNLTEKNSVSLINRSLYWIMRAKPDYIKLLLTKFTLFEIQPAIILELANLLKEFNSDYENTLLLYSKLIDITKESSLIGVATYDLMNIDKDRYVYKDRINEMISKSLEARRFLKIYNQRRLLNNQERAILKRYLPQISWKPYYTKYPPSYPPLETLNIASAPNSIVIALFIGTGDGESLSREEEEILAVFRRINIYRKININISQYVCDADIDGNGGKEIVVPIPNEEGGLDLGIYFPKEKSFIIDSIGKRTWPPSTLIWAEDVNFDGKDEILGFGISAGSGHLFHILSWNGKFFDHLSLWNGVPQDRDNDGIPEIIYDEGCSESAEPALLRWNKEEKKYIKDTLFTFKN